MADERTKNDQVEQDEEVEEVEGGTDQDSEGGEGSGTKGGSKGGSGQADKTFTQDQVNHMMAREKKQGRAAALKELGIDPKDTKAIAMVKALIESQKTEEQKAAEKAAEENERQSEAERRAIVAEAKAEAMMIGVQPQYVADVVDLALAKMGEDGDLKSIIGDFKTKYPMWFNTEDDDGKGSSSKGGKKAGQKGTGSSIKGNAGGKDGDGNKSLGARLAAQRKTSHKSSYWSGGKR